MDEQAGRGQTSQNDDWKRAAGSSTLILWGHTTLQTLWGTKMYCKDCRRCTYKNGVEMQEMSNAPDGERHIYPHSRTPWQPLGTRCDINGDRRDTTINHNHSNPEEKDTIKYCDERLEAAEAEVPRSKESHQCRTKKRKGTEIS